MSKSGKATTETGESFTSADGYQNLTLVTATVHKLIHATDSVTIQKTFENLQARYENRLVQSVIKKVT